MEYTPLAQGPMVTCGSAVLRALQNESSQPLDLLVREAVQNSLDAAEPVSREVDVKFRFASCDASKVAAVLDGPVGEELRQCPPGNQGLLEVRDEGTTGLTGSLCLDELPPGCAHGNLIKLVYELGRAQDRADAGGSWGIGKTVFFRIGIGLVFFYTRLREGDAFEERLAACLVEDERAGDRLQAESQTGISWWGSRSDKGGPKPLTQPGLVKDVLDALGIEPFKDQAVGTVIAVPFLRQDLVAPWGLDRDGGLGGEGADPRPPWVRSAAEFVRTALQRWYAPRLGNRDFASGPMLRAWVDGQELMPRDMLPAARIAQDLYNRCVTGETKGYLRDVDADVSVLEVGPFNAIFARGRYAGKLAVVTLSPEQLGMGPPGNHWSPRAMLLGKSDAVRCGPPIVGFMRRHGMIVAWSGDDGYDTWSCRLQAEPDPARQSLAVFVPDGCARLAEQLLAKLKGGTKATTLDEYLRRCENADHFTWKDPAELNVVQRIRDRVKGLLEKHLEPSRGHEVVEPGIVPGRLLARLLPEGFGREATPPSPGTFPPPPPPKQGVRFVVRVVTRDAQGITVDWNASWRGDRACRITGCIQAEAGRIDALDWGKDKAEAEFPLRVTEPRTNTAGATVQYVGPEADCVLLVRHSGRGKHEVQGTMRLVVRARPAQVFHAVLEAKLEAAGRCVT